MGSTLRSTLCRLRPSTCLYILYVCTYLSIGFSDVNIFDLLWQGLIDDSIYLGFAYEANRHTQNLASTAWVIYYPYGQLMVSRWVCIGPALNNIAEYIFIINLLSKAISFDIDSLVVYLDLELTVSQLNNVYQVQDPYFYCQFLRVRLLQRSFIYITYVHFPRLENSLADFIANQALDWHINHSSNWKT